MAATNDNPNTSKSKKRKQRYLPHNKPVKKKGSYPLHPGIRGFFITCDGGRERQASRDAIYLIDSFYEELIQGKHTETKQLDESVNKPLNKKIKFVYSDDEEDDDGDDDEEEEEEKVKEKTEEDVKEEQEEGNGDDNSNACQSSDDKNGIQTNDEGLNGACVDNSSQGNQAEDKGDTKPGDESGEPLAKKPCQETCLSTTSDRKVEEKSIDKLIDDELKELGDKSKKLFVNLDAGCNGVAIVQMRKTDEGPSPKDIIHHIMTSAASTRKHMSRFILRILPVEVACYASEEEISRAMTMIVENYFPANAQEPQKFAVLYEARANTGIDRMKIINAVAKSVPAPHKVDLSNPEKTIVVEIVKTVCLIGVVEKYKEWAKYNLRQLTSSKH